MSSKKDTKVIYQFPNYSAKQCAEDYVKYITRINEEIKMHHHVDELCANGEKIQAFLDFNASGFNHIQPSRSARKSRKRNEHDVRENPLVIPKKMLEWEWKFKWLCDYLIRESIEKCKEDSEAYIDINAKLIRRVVGSSYRKMLDMLAYKRLIFLKEGEWKINVSPMNNEKNFSYTPSKYIMIEEDYDMIEVSRDFYNRLQKKRRIFFDANESQKENTNQEESPFIKTYKKNLKYLQLDKVTEFKAWTKDIKFQEKKKKYQERVQIIAEKMCDLKEKTHIKEDKRQRVYSLLTNMPKEMKQFTNRKFEVDISNCHPLLFNKLLQEVMEYAQNQQDTNKLDLYNKDCDGGCLQPTPILPTNLRTEELVQFVCKMLKNNKLQNEVLKYKGLTESGKIWEYFLQFSPNVSRQEIKKRMFSSIFYGNLPVIRNYKNIIIPEDTPKGEQESARDYALRIEERKQLKNWHDMNMYADMFRNEFPCIWRFIAYLRKHCRAVDVGDGEQKASSWLSHALTILESKIIREVLQRLWNEGYKVLNIHDNIFVLDVEENRNLTAEHVKETMLEVLSNYGLKGNVKVEY